LVLVGSEEDIPIEIREALKKIEAHLKKQFEEGEAKVIVHLIKSSFVSLYMFKKERISNLNAKWLNLVFSPFFLELIRRNVVIEKLIREEVRRRTLEK